MTVDNDTQSAPAAEPAPSGFDSDNRPGGHDRRLRP